MLQTGNQQEDWLSGASNGLQDMLPRSDLLRARQKAPLDPSFAPPASQAPEHLRGGGSFTQGQTTSWARGSDPLRDRSGSNLDNEGPAGFSAYGGGHSQSTAYSGGLPPAGGAVVSAAAPVAAPVVTASASYRGGPGAKGCT
ncbi:unnamed protein product [Durusdinium trenchii]|uniref:Uncharacterized protein n=1 Tax=Durusdinium trenchii TaxID=1381693 RepID=A0ABP0IHF1_9DINO